MSDNIVKVPVDDELRIRVKVGSGHDGVQLPTGFAYDDGDEVVLTVHQFNKLNIDRFHGDNPVLINLGPEPTINYDGEYAEVSGLGNTLTITDDSGGLPDDEVDLNTSPDFDTFTLEYKAEVGSDDADVTEAASWFIDGGNSTGVAVVALNKVNGTAEVSWTTAPVENDEFDLTVVYGTNATTLTIEVVDNA